MGIPTDNPVPPSPRREREPLESAPLRIRRLLDDATTLPAGESFDERRRQVALDIMSLLLDWRSRGGEIRFEPPGAGRLGEAARVAAPRPGSGVDPVVLLQSVLDGIVFSNDDEVEVLRLHAAIRDSDRWRILPRELQRAVVALTVARLRRLQDDRRLIHPRLEECFSMLTAFSKREQPGYVVGLSRHHTPVRGSWQEDAEAWWERLRAMANPSAATPGGADKLYSGIQGAIVQLGEADPDDRASAEEGLRKAVLDAIANGIPTRDGKMVKLLAPFVGLLEVAELRGVRAAVRGEPEEEGEEEPEEPTEDWRGWSRTRGRRAILVGGEEKPLARVRLQRIFGFSELEWVPMDAQRTLLPAVKEKVFAGRVDLVLVLARYVAHELDEVILPVCKERGVDVAHVERGYSVGRVRQAVEKLLAGPPTA